MSHAPHEGHGLIAHWFYVSYRQQQILWRLPQRHFFPLLDEEDNCYYCFPSFPILHQLERKGVKQNTLVMGYRPEIWVGCTSSSLKTKEA
jgi:hypothetical protein